MAYGPVDRASRYPVWLGVVLLSVGFTLHYLSVQAARDLGVGDAGLFRVTPVAWDLTPGPGDPGSLGPQLFVGALRTLYATLSAVGLLLTVVGLVSVVVGVVAVRRRALAVAGRRLARALTDPRQAAVLVALFAVVVGILTSPVFRRVVVNAVTFTVVSVSGFVLAAAGVVSLERRSGPIATVVLVWPLAVSALFLSVVVGTFASPATGEFMVRLTRGLVRILLRTVFSVGGLDRLLTRTFELEGAGFLAFWVGVNVVVGVALGLASRRYPSLSIEAPVRWVRDAVTRAPPGESAR